MAFRVANGVNSLATSHSPVRPEDDDEDGPKRRLDPAYVSDSTARVSSANNLASSSCTICELDGEEHGYSSFCWSDGSCWLARFQSDTSTPAIPSPSCQSPPRSSATVSLVTPRYCSLHVQLIKIGNSKWITRTILRVIRA